MGGASGQEIYLSWVLYFQPWKAIKTNGKEITNDEESVKKAQQIYISLNTETNTKKKQDMNKNLRTVHLPASRGSPPTTTTS